MRVALDSNIFIYALGRDDTWHQPAVALLKQIEHGTLTGVASTLVLSEVLAYPFRMSQQQGEDAQLFMEGLEGIDYVAMNLEIAIRSSQLRARFGPRLSTPDAIHLASAVAAQAEVFVTNDYGLLKLKLDDITIHLLGETLN